MRDPNRIPEFLAIVQRCWEKVPDWRFGQLIENLKRFMNKQDLFYIEDDDLATYLLDFFNISENNK